MPVLLPRHYLNVRPRRLIQAYVGDYLREEIAAEAFDAKYPGLQPVSRSGSPVERRVDQL